MGMNGAKPRRRGLLALWLAVPVLLLAAIHTLLWRWAEQRLLDGFEAWAAARREAGWTVRSGQPVAAGWPLAARLVVKQIAVEGGEDDLPGGFAWSGERVTISVGLLRPRLLSILPDGAQTLRIGGSSVIPYTADALRVDVPLEPGMPARSAELAASGVRAGIPAGREARAVTIGLLRGHADARPGAAPGEPALTVQTSVEAVVLPAGTRWALGQRISSASLDGSISGPVPRMPGLARRAAAWRDGGGSLQVQRLALGWGPLGLTGSATLALDDHLQPMGTASARVIGYAETLDALVAGGSLGAHVAEAIKAVAGLIATAPEAGGPSDVEVPLTLQDRMLLVRQIPVSRMPALQWPPG
jgi:hypothetical protein